MKAYFAGGCFWCVTPIYKIYGEDKVLCGYSGGDEPNPTYEDVKAQRTGHRETIALEYDEKNVVTFPESEAWDLSQYTEWDTVYLWMWMPAKILKITDKDITLDLNHELAGKNLIFDITVKEISWEVNNTDNEIEQSDENEEATK